MKERFSTFWYLTTPNKNFSLKFDFCVPLLTASAPPGVRVPQLENRCNKKLRKERKVMSLNVYLMDVGILELLHTHNANNKNKVSQMGQNKINVQERSL
jgi:hypothetical protein